MPEVPGSCFSAAIWLPSAIFEDPNPPAIVQPLAVNPSLVVASIVSSLTDTLRLAGSALDACSGIHFVQIARAPLLHQQELQSAKGTSSQPKPQLARRANFSCSKYGHDDVWGAPPPAPPKRTLPSWTPVAFGTRPARPWLRVPFDSRGWIPCDPSRNTGREGTHRKELRHPKCCRPLTS